MMDRHFVSMHWMYPKGADIDMVFGHEPYGRVAGNTPSQELLDLLAGGAEYARMKANQKGVPTDEERREKNKTFRLPSQNLHFKYKTKDAKLVGTMSTDTYFNQAIRPNTPAEEALLLGLSTSVLPTYSEHLSQPFDSSKKVKVTLRKEDSMPWVQDSQFAKEFSKLDGKLVDGIPSKQSDPVYNLQQFFSSCKVKVKGVSLPDHSAGHSFRWLFSRRIEREQKRKQTLDARFSKPNLVDVSDKVDSPINIVCVIKDDKMDIEVDGYSLRDALVLTSGERAALAIIRGHHPGVIEYEYLLGLYCLGNFFIPGLDKMFKEYLSWLRLSRKPDLSTSCMRVLVRQALARVTC